MIKWALMLKILPRSLIFCEVSFTEYNERNLAYNVLKFKFNGITE
jgi:hypothetical protein